MDNDETGQALDGAEALARQIRQVVIPEIDTYIYGEMCKGAGVKPEPVVLTAGNIYDESQRQQKALTIRKYRKQTEF